MQNKKGKPSGCCFAVGSTRCALQALRSHTIVQQYRWGIIIIVVIIIIINITSAIDCGDIKRAARQQLTELLTSSWSFSCRRFTVFSQSLWIAPKDDTCECFRRMPLVMEKYLHVWAGDVIGVHTNDADPNVEDTVSKFVSVHIDINISKMPCRLETGLARKRKKRSHEKRKLKACKANGTAVYLIALAYCPSSTASSSFCGS